MVLRNEHLSDLAIGLVDAAPRGCRQLIVAAPGTPAMRTRLAALPPGDLLRGPIVNPAMAQGVLCGLWLWHDFLDEAHALAQADSTVTGSLWHAIMHRRQGDFANSRHWYARCRRHFILGPLAQHVSVMTNTLPADTRLLRMTLNGWDADAFVDLVEDVAPTPADPLHALAVEIQQLEWRLLLEHCAAQAVEGT
jgi:hypothetical protein